MRPPAHGGPRLVPRLPAGTGTVARVGFLALVVVAAWWSLRGRWGEVGDALAAVPAGAVAAALVLTVAGLLVTGEVWRAVLGWFGPRPGRAAAWAVFFPGQLGKYVPGSVWSIGAQAALARTVRAPARVVVATSLVFLGVQVASALVVGGAVLTAAQPATGPADGLLGRPWAGPVLVLVGLLALAPPVIAALAGRVAAERPVLDLRRVAGVAVASAVVWGAYAVGVVLLVPPAAPAGGAALLPVVLAAFPLAYAAGVLVLLAPAGLGAREAVFVAVLGPVLGLAAATALAVLARVVHLVADLLVALLGAGLARRRRRSGDAAVQDCRTPVAPSSP